MLLPALLVALCTSTVAPLEPRSLALVIAGPGFEVEAVRAAATSGRRAEIRVLGDPSAHAFEAARGEGLALHVEPLSRSSLEAAFVWLRAETEPARGAPSELDIVVVGRGRGDALSLGELNIGASELLRRIAALPAAKKDVLVFAPGLVQPARQRPLHLRVVSTIQELHAGLSKRLVRDDGNVRLEGFRAPVRLMLGGDGPTLTRWPTLPSGGVRLELPPARYWVVEETSESEASFADFGLKPERSVTLTPAFLSASLPRPAPPPSFHVVGLASGEVAAPSFGVSASVEVHRHRLFGGVEGGPRITPEGTKGRAGLRLGFLGRPGALAAGPLLRAGVDSGGDGYAAPTLTARLALFEGGGLFVDAGAELRRGSASALGSGGLFFALR